MALNFAQLPRDSDSQYRPLFRRYLAGALRRSLVQVRRHPYTVPNEVRVQTWHLLTLALDDHASWKSLKGLLLSLAPRMEQMGFYQDWIPYLKRGIGKSKENSDPLTEGRLAYHLGVLYRLMGRYDDARRALERSSYLFESVEEPIRQATAYSQLAYVAWQRGQVEETIRNAEAALRRLPEDHVERAMAYSALGLIAVEQQRYSVAEGYHRRALKIRRLHGDQRLIAWSLQNLGVALCRQNNFPEAIQHYEDALASLETIDDGVNQGVVHLNLGLAHHFLQDYAEALKSFAQAEAIFRDFGDIGNLGRLLVNRGLTYFATENFPDAEKCFRSAVRLYSDLGNDGLRLNAMDGIIMVKMALQKYAEARDLLGRARSELEALPDLPNAPYLRNSFSNRQRALQAWAKGTAFLPSPCTF